MVKGFSLVSLVSYTALKCQSLSLAAVILITVCLGVYIIQLILFEILHFLDIGIFFFLVLEKFLAFFFCKTIKPSFY